MDSGLEPLEIKNQLDTFCCVAFASTSVSEDQEGVILSPEYTIKNISKILNDPMWVYGGTSLDVGAEAIAKGALEHSQCPYTLEKDGIDKIANPPTGTPFMTIWLLYTAKWGGSGFIPKTEWICSIQYAQLSTHSETKKERC